MVKIYKIDNLNSRKLTITAEVSDKKYGLLFQEILRDILSSRFSIESTFGLDEDYEPFLFFDYPFNKRFEFVWENQGDQVAVGIRFINKKAKKDLTTNKND